MLLVITGTRFGATRGASYVKFNGTQAASYGPWVDDRLEVYVPGGEA